MSWAKVTKGLRLTEVRENVYQRMEIAVGPERAVECEEEFEQVLEAKVAEMDVTELKHENVQALVEKSMLKAVRETKVKFVLCADSGLGKLHIRKNGTTCWCGRQWSQSVSDELPRGGQMLKMFACAGLELGWRRRGVGPLKSNIRNLC